MGNHCGRILHLRKLWLAHSSCTLRSVVPTHKITLTSIFLVRVLVTPALCFHQSMKQWHPVLAEQLPRKSSHVSCNQEALERLLHIYGHLHPIESTWNSDHTAHSSCTLRSFLNFLPSRMDLRTNIFIVDLAHTTHRLIT